MVSEMSKQNGSESIVDQGMMSPEDVARFLGFSIRTIYDMMADGTLPFTKIRNSRRIPRKRVMQIASDGMTAGK